MSIKNKEHYEFDVPEKGLNYDILDMAFNPTTQSFIASNGIQPGMRVLDVGSGSGIMTHYLSKCVGQTGMVLSIDNSPEQLKCAQGFCQQQGCSNVIFKQLSVYDLNLLNETFDFIYCRFVLHHLHSPKLVLKLFYQKLRQGGIYIAEEGIVSSAFSYPPSYAWSYNRGEILVPDKEKEGIQRDSDFGMKLFYWMKKIGFIIKDIKLMQPVFITKTQKKNLLGAYDAYKKTALLQGKSESDWLLERQELIRLINDDFELIGFYQSCQVSGVK